MGPILSDYDVLQYSIVDCVIMSVAFPVFTEIFVNQVFTLLCDCMPIVYQRYIEEHVSDETKLPGLLPNVECIPVHIACIVIPKASSMKSLACVPVDCCGSCP